MSETYLRVCTLPRGHDGPHLAYQDAPAKDPDGNKEIAWPRCVHVDPLTYEPRERFRVVFEMIDPRMPAAGWHAVVNEHADLDSARRQFEGLIAIGAEGDPVRNARIERTVVKWESVE